MNHQKTTTTSEERFRLLQYRLKKARAKMDNLNVGDSITLLYHEGKRMKQREGVVEVKYPDKLLIRNRHGRLEMITFADLLTMKVVE